MKLQQPSGAAHELSFQGLYDTRQVHARHFGSIEVDGYFLIAEPERQSLQFRALLLVGLYELEILGCFGAKSFAGSVPDVTEQVGNLARKIINGGLQV